MADEQNSGDGSIRRRLWNPVVSDPVVSTVLLELVGLVFAGLVALVAWPFGWRPDPSLVALTTSMVAIGPATELYHAGSRRVGSLSSPPSSRWRRWPCSSPRWRTGPFRYDLVVEGEAVRVADDARLRELAAEWEAKYGSFWHFDVREGLVAARQGARTRPNRSIV